jgi:uncharacterized protein YbbK (DUF523 family)
MTPTLAVLPAIGRLHARLHGDAPEEAAAAAREVGTAGRPVVATSSCLLGIRCRYNGGDQLLSAIVARAASCALLPLCPEVLAGLGVPRAPASFDGDGDGAAALAGTVRLRDANGRDVTRAFIDGARRADELMRLAGASAAWLKERSPSCGVNQVHCGDTLINGRGVFAALVATRGIPLQSDEDLA